MENLFRRCLIDEKHAASNANSDYHFVSVSMTMLSLLNMMIGKLGCGHPLIMRRD